MRYTKETKSRALVLYRRGLSYDAIGSKLGVAKSTLSTWMGKNPRLPSDGSKQRAHLAKIRIIAARSKTRIKEEWVARARTSGIELASGFPYKNMVALKSLLAMLYWAEGTKAGKISGVVFTNTDPILMLLYLTLLRKVYGIDEARLKIRLHLHHYHRHKETISFWSKLLAVPSSQFGKIYVKKRNRHKRFRKNFQGVCFVRYFDSKIREELLALGKAIAEKVR